MLVTRIVLESNGYLLEDFEADIVIEDIDSLRNSKTYSTFLEDINETDEEGYIVAECATYEVEISKEVTNFKKFMSEEVQDDDMTYLTSFNTTLNYGDF